MDPIQIINQMENSKILLLPDILSGLDISIDIIFSFSFWLNRVTKIYINFQQTFSQQSIENSKLQFVQFYFHAARLSPFTV